MKPQNRLCYGDCLAVMREMPDDSVDLIYLDPPFNSSRDYAAIYKDETGRPLPDRIENFSDTWRLDAEREACLQRLPDLMQGEAARLFWRHWIAALRQGEPSMLAYLSCLAERVLAMRRLLKPGGSLYFHCDPTASHYVKLMLDSIFGRANFRNEIVWCYTGPGSPRMRQFNRKHDVILWYSNGPGWTFNKDAVRLPHAGGGPHAGGFGTGGRRPDDPEYAARGKVPESWWRDIAIAPRSSREYLGYATQKPLALLRRIILAGSNPGDMVLDPFCGSATALEAAHRLGRRWIGIDAAIHAVRRVARLRLAHSCGLREGEEYALEGIPRDMQGARELCSRDSRQFQKWAIEQVEGLVTTRRGVDGGVDGRLYFSLPGEGPLQSMMLQVQDGAGAHGGAAGQPGALLAALEEDDALLAGLILLHRPGGGQMRHLRQCMARAGDVELPGGPCPRLQLLTVAEILDGGRFRAPAGRPCGQAGGAEPTA